MMLSLFTAGVGFLVIFVANKDYTIPGLIPLKRVSNSNSYHISNLSEPMGYQILINKALDYPYKALDPI